MTMTSDVSQRIGRILAARRVHLPAVRARITEWTALDGALETLQSALDDLAAYPGAPAELRELARAQRAHGLRSRVAASIDALRVVESRFGRPTINIGVSGQARVGKSTLLQAISGLTDEQVPTGRDLPVTAVRSRLAHSGVHRRATLRLHTFASFVHEVIEPYHREIGIAGVPATLAELRAWQYPASKDDLPDVAKRDTHGALLVRLKEMQRALPSYEGYLTGEELVVDLEHLREFVAYPTHEQETQGDARRPYLAVRSALIECPFPFAQVDNLVLLDLPGLGEVAVDTERHHVAGLQHAVDVVLFVKRPLTGIGFWQDRDDRALRLLREARGMVKRPRDFVLFVVNRGDDPALTEALLGDIRRKVNEGEDGRHYRVLVCDARDPRSVHEAVLTPLLEHLAESLPAMDADVLAGALSQAKAAAREIEQAARDIAADLAALAPEAAGTAEMLHERTAEMRKSLASELHDLVAGLLQEARGSVEDQAFIAAVEGATTELRGFIGDGFGRGLEAWKSDALRTLRQDMGSGPFITHELNRIRVEVSRRYAAIDNFLARRVEELWSKIAGILGKNSGGLLGDGSGQARLARFGQALAGASEPCPSLGDAVTALLGLRIEYRTHLHPRVRRVLDLLHPQQRDTRSGDIGPLLLVEVSERGVDVAARRLSQLAEQAVYETQKALLADLALPALILHAAAEQFEDALVRGGDSDREFRRLARSYRDEIWPGVFQGIDARNARINRVTRAAQDVSRSIAAIVESSTGASA